MSKPSTAELPLGYDIGSSKRIFMGLRISGPLHVGCANPKQIPTKIWMILALIVPPKVQRVDFDPRYCTSET